MVASKELLFTYGTLRKDEENPMQNYLEKQAHWIGKALVQGELHYAGGHPAAIASGDEKRQILGDLYEFDKESGLLQELDRYEGYRPGEPVKSLYLRKKRMATLLENKEKRVAWIYIYNQPLDEAVPILSGDYVKFREI